MISNRNKFIFIRISKTAGRAMSDVLSAFEDEFYRNPHLSALQVRKRVGEARFNEYFKFSFVRNPWDRMVSQFFWRRDGKGIPKIPPNKTFSEWIKELNPTIPACIGPHQSTYGISNQFQHLRDEQGNCCVDFIGKFEHLSEDWPRLLRQLSLPITSLQIRNKTQHLPYREYYNSETQDIVRRRYLKDIEIFNYQF